MKYDPRTRIITVLLISSAAVIIKDPAPLFLVLLLTLLLCKVFSISLLGAVKKLRKLWYFFIILALIQSVFTSGGEALIKIGSLRLLTSAGLETGVSIIVRLSIIICSALIIAGTSIMEIVYGLIALKLPYEIAFMVLLAIKFLPLFKEEFEDSIIAVQLAGADPVRIPVKKKLSLYTYILMPAVTKALHRARFISLSMESRSFRAYPTRTSYQRLQMNRADYVTLLGITITIFSILNSQYNFIG